MTVWAALLSRLNRHACGRLSPKIETERRRCAHRACGPHRIIAEVVSPRGVWVGVNGLRFNIEHTRVILETIGAGSRGGLVAAPESYN